MGKIIKNNLWGIKVSDFSLLKTPEERIKFLLRYAILAPSTHNSQPWQFKIEKDLMRIYFDPQLKIPEADPLGRDLYISMGCLLENLQIAANFFGMLREINIVLKDNLIAEMRWQEPHLLNEDWRPLIEAIPKRINARGFFERKPLPEPLLQEIRSWLSDERIRVDLLEDREKIKKLAELTAKGLKLAYKRPTFRKEMSGWMHHSWSARKIGLPGYALRMPLLISFIFPLLVRFLDLGPFLAKLNYRSMSSAPLVFVFSARESNPAVWLEVGRLAERYMLQLNARGLRTSIFVASIEMGDLSKEVQDVIGITERPHFVFCAGQMEKVPRHSPRIEVEQKLI